MIIEQLQAQLESIDPKVATKIVKIMEAYTADLKLLESRYMDKVNYVFNEYLEEQKNANIT